MREHRKNRKDSHMETEAETGVSAKEFLGPPEHEEARKDPLWSLWKECNTATP